MLFFNIPSILPSGALDLPPKRKESGSVRHCFFTFIIGNLGGALLIDADGTAVLSDDERLSYDWDDWTPPHECMGRLRSFSMQ